MTQLGTRADLAERREKALAPGSQRSIDRQHERNKMLARERIHHLLDDGSFHELDMLARHRRVTHSPTDPTETASSPDGALVTPRGVRVLPGLHRHAFPARCSPRRSTS
ncbi:MAG: carboxyl transferase domain-containing protein [Microthrixaceae bacterium]